MYTMGPWPGSRRRATAGADRRRGGPEVARQTGAQRSTCTRRQCTCFRARRSATTSGTAPGRARTGPPRAGTAETRPAPPAFSGTAPGSHAVFAKRCAAPSAVVGIAPACARSHTPVARRPHLFGSQAAAHTQLVRVATPARRDAAAAAVSERGVDRIVTAPRVVQVLAAARVACQPAPARALPAARTFSSALSQPGTAARARMCAGLAVARGRTEFVCNQPHALNGVAARPFLRGTACTRGTCTFPSLLAARHA